MEVISNASYSFTPCTGFTRLLLLRTYCILPQQCGVIPTRKQPLVTNCPNTLPAIMLAVYYLLKPFTIRDGTHTSLGKMYQVLMKDNKMVVKDSIRKTAEQTVVTGGILI